MNSATLISSCNQLAKKNLRLITLVGLPGSGKTTACKQFQSKFTRVSQDDLGSRLECEKMLKEIFSKGGNAVIDRCNVSKHERMTWSKIAQRHGINKDECAILHVDTNASQCHERILSREGQHPTIKTTDPLRDRNHFEKIFVLML